MSGCSESGAGLEARDHVMLNLSVRYVRKRARVKVTIAGLLFVGALNATELRFDRLCDLVVSVCLFRLLLGFCPFFIRVVDVFAFVPEFAFALLPVKAGLLLFVAFTPFAFVGVGFGVVHMPALVAEFAIARGKVAARCATRLGLAALIGVVAFGRPAIRIGGRALNRCLFGSGHIVELDGSQLQRHHKRLHSCCLAIAGLLLPFKYGAPVAPILVDEIDHVLRPLLLAEGALDLCQLLAQVIEAGEPLLEGLILCFEHGAICKAGGDCHRGIEVCFTSECRDHVKQSADVMSGLVALRRQECRAMWLHCGDHLLIHSLAHVVFERGLWPQGAGARV